MSAYFWDITLVDVRQFGCDFLACSAYKFYGPHVGILWTRSDLIDEIDVPRLIPAADHGPERLETGTLNHEGIVGTAGAIDFLAAIGQGRDRRHRLAAAFTVLHQRSALQLETLWDGLRSIPGIQVYGPAPELPRTPTVSFTLAGRSSIAVAQSLAGMALFVSHGDFYAHTVVERLGVTPSGLVRVGCACYTSDDEIERLLAAVRATARADS